MDEETPPERPPSRSAKKRAAHAHTELAEILLGLPAEHLKLIPLPDQLRRVIEEGQSIPPSNARRRHTQYVGRLLGALDDQEPIRAALLTRSHLEAQNAQAFQSLEALRARLLGPEAESKAALAELVSAFPAADLEPIRAALKKARAELKAEKQTAARLLFRRLRELGAPPKSGSRP